MSARAIRPLQLLYAAIGTAGLAAGAMLLADFPVARLPLAIFFAAYAGAVWLKPALWLFAVPALLPSLDLAPWSGSLAIEEFDFLLLVTACVGYARLAPRLDWKSWPSGAAGFGLIGLSTLIALGIGWRGMPDALWTSDYLSPLNSWRVARGFLWVWLMLPLLRATLASEPDALRRRFVPGMVTGLALVSVIALWERAAFPGLLDFAEDYRISAGFSGMHVGGAALDGYLALALPFALGGLLSARSWLISALLAPLMLAALYVALVTYSRGVYLALIVSALAAAILCWPAPRTGERVRLLAAAALAGCLVWALSHAFPAGGVRVLAAGAAALAATAAVSALSRRVLGRGWYGLGLLLFGAATAAIALVADKAIYFLVALAALMAGGGLIAALVQEGRKAPAIVAALGASGLVMTTLGVAYHHAAQPALTQAAWIALAALLVYAVNRHVRPRLWAWGRAQALTIAVLGAGAVLAIPIAGNYYMGSRFADSARDLTGREAHWRSVLEVMPAGAAAMLFGAGAGSMPGLYFWRDPNRDVPGSYAFAAEQGNAFLRLGAPQYAQGFGEALRFGQRISLSRAAPATLSFRARGAGEKTRLVIAACEKLLLYARHPCIGKTVILSPEWRRYTVPLQAQMLGRSDDRLWRPVQFSLHNEIARTTVEVDDLVLIDARGENVIRNGDFSARHARWFFTSDHHHLPWHAKNMALHLYFEQGVLGAGAVLGLIVWCVLRLARMRPVTPMAVMLLAGVSGFVAVGLFDSLLDMPRVNFLFFLTLAAAASFEPPAKATAPA